VPVILRITVSGTVGSGHIRPAAAHLRSTYRPGLLSLNALGIGLAVVNRWLSVAIYVTVALMWLDPTTRLDIHDLRVEPDRANRVHTGW
jgi:hypothetical protein